MVLIKEEQHVLNEIHNNQERVIQYNSWEDYVDDVRTFDKLKSIPRQAKINDLQVYNNWLTFTFFLGSINKTIVHYAFIEEVI